MKFSFQRFLSLVMLLAFITAASYQSLCAVDIIHCPPCEKEGAENAQELACKNCQQSEEVGSVTIGIHKISVQLDAVSADYVNADTFVFGSPEFILPMPQAPPIVLVRPHTEIIQSTTPIRGPSITA